MLSLRFETMIVTGPSELQAVALCRARLCMTAGLGAVAAVRCSVVYHLVGGHSLYLILPMMLLFWLKGLIGVLESWNNRCGVYGLMASVALKRTLAQGLLSVVFSLLGLRAWGLLLRHLLGLMMGVRRQAWTLWQKRGEMCIIRWREIRDVLHIYRRQALYATSSVFANRFSYQLITLMMDASSACQRGHGARHWRSGVDAGALGVSRAVQRNVDGLQRHGAGHGAHADDASGNQRHCGHDAAQRAPVPGAGVAGVHGIRGAARWLDLPLQR